MCNEDDPAKLTVAQLGGNVHVESEEEGKKEKVVFRTATNSDMTVCLFYVACHAERQKGCTVF